MNHNDKSEMGVDNKSDATVNMDDQDSPHSINTESLLREDEIIQLKQEIQELKDKYLRQIAEFENFKKRNARERIELIQTAGKDVIVSLLEVVDDCDRAEKQIQNNEDLGTIKEGIQLIFNKLRNSLHSKGLKVMQTIGLEFNADQHEAITEIPVTTEESKGKVIDEVEKGYYLNDKIIRFAKVVVGK